MSGLNAIKVLSGSRKGYKLGHLKKAIWPFVATAAWYRILFNWKRMQEVCGALKKTQSLKVIGIFSSVFFYKITIIK